MKIAHFSVLLYLSFKISRKKQKHSRPPRQNPRKGGSFSAVSDYIIIYNTHKVNAKAGTKRKKRGDKTFDDSARLYYNTLVKGYILERKRLPRKTAAWLFGGRT
jgi:hypothetical protein